MTCGSSGGAFIGVLAAGMRWTITQPQPPLWERKIEHGAEAALSGRSRVLHLAAAVGPSKMNAVLM